MNTSGQPLVSELERELFTSVSHGAKMTFSLTEHVLTSSFMDTFRETPTTPTTDHPSTSLDLHHTTTMKKQMRLGYVSSRQNQKSAAHVVSFGHGKSCP